MISTGIIKVGWKSSSIEKIHEIDSKYGAETQPWDRSPVSVAVSPSSEHSAARQSQVQKNSSFLENYTPKIDDRKQEVLFIDTSL